MDPFQVLEQQLAPEVAAALQQLITNLSADLQEARQIAQTAQNNLLTQQQFEQALSNALSQAHLTVQNSAPTAAPAMRGSLRVAPQRFSGNIDAADGNVNHWITIFLDAVRASAVPADLWVPTAATVKPPISHTSHKS